MTSAARCFDIDVEKAAGYSSPSLSSDSPRDQPSPTVTYTGGDTEEGADVVSNITPFAVRPTEYHTVPAYHRPFSLPSVCPVPPRALQESRSLDNVRITVQTRYSTAG